MRKYISPKIEFKNLGLKQNIAKTCWGHHSSSKELFYDYSGGGYIEFYVTNSNCNISQRDHIKVIYHDINTSEEKKAFDELYNKITSEFGGNSGNPFHGEGEFIFPDYDPKWS